MSDVDAVWSQEGRPPPGPALPLAEVQAQLENQISSGVALCEKAKRVSDEYRRIDRDSAFPDALVNENKLRAQAFLDDLEIWRDFNRAWLERFISHAAAEEYWKIRNAELPEVSMRYSVWIQSADVMINYADQVRAETTKLRSILGRLALWTPSVESAEAPEVPGAGGTRPAGHAFLSYAQDDSLAVDRLQQILEAARILVWRDTNLQPGEDRNIRIRREIASDALAFIACFSTKGARRNTSYQNEELTQAVEQFRLRSPGMPWLIPVRLDDCDIPDLDLGGGRSLAAIQRVDLFGERREQGIAQLVAAILRILTNS